MSVVADLTEALGPEVVSETAPERYHSDWSGLPPVQPLALARPRTTEEVSTTLRLCHEAGVGVVPQGGLTGLCGGARPRMDCIALSTDRMTAIEAIDPAAGTMTAESGVILEVAQAA
ncbi:MAG: FAD-binding oxidoreductase, partial [Pseudomonadota bacterium]